MTSPDPLNQRNQDRKLILGIAEGSTGSRAYWALDPQPLLPFLVEEFDLAILDTDANGEPILRQHFGGGTASVPGTVRRLTSEASGDLPDLLASHFAADPPDVIHMQSGATSLYKLTDILDALPSRRVVSINGWTEAQSVCRRWADRLSSIDFWLTDSTATLDQLNEAASHSSNDLNSIADEATVVIEPGTDLAQRFGADTTTIDERQPLRLGIVAGLSAHSSLVRVDRLMTLLDQDIEIHIFGAAPGASDGALVCHSGVPAELLVDSLAAARIHLVECTDGRSDTQVRHAALAAGAALLSPPVGSTAELIRLTGAGWITDPEDLRGNAELLGNLAKHRFEVNKTMHAARALKMPSRRSEAAHLAEVLRKASHQ